MDAACYGAMCKIAQPYLMRYPLVDGDGNLGSQEANGMEAASRYTNARPSKIADLMMRNFNKNVVPLKRTYNNEYDEPVVLPALFPNALANGREAIGISLSHSSLPHNLTEVCDAISAYIQGNLHNADDLMSYMKGPDFPLGGTIINGRDIKAAFATGQSQTSLKIRGDYTVNGQSITFTSIPYRTYRNKIKEQINKNIDIFDTLLADFNDESSQGNNRLIFTAKKGVSTARVLSKLFDLTDLESSVSYNMNFIVNGTPKMCSMLDLIEAYYKHQTDVFLNATVYDKTKAEDRKHIIEGLLAALGDIDKVINLIRNSSDKDEARSKLIALLLIDTIQANAILDMRLSKLTKLDNAELLTELAEKEAIITECEKIINEKDYRDSLLVKMIEDLKLKYGDARKTQIDDIVITKEEKEIAKVEPEKVVVILTEANNIKRIPASSYKEQNRNTKGVKVQKNDITKLILKTNTIDNLLVFSNLGRVYKLLIDDIPVGTNSSSGVPINSLIEFKDGEDAELVCSMNRNTTAKYVLFVTKLGIVKKVALSDFNGLRRKTGVQAAAFKDNDSIASINLISEEDLLLISHNGQIIKMKSDFGASGRTAIGVKGMSLAPDDYIVSTLPITNNQEHVTIFTSNGMGKRVLLSEFTTQNRGGKGVKICKTGLNITCACMSKESDSLLVSGSTNSICLSASAIPIINRLAIGNIIIKNDVVIGVSKI